MLLFIRDIADGDLVGWIDGRIAEAFETGDMGDCCRRVCREDAPIYVQSSPPRSFFHGGAGLGGLIGEQEATYW